VVIKHPLQEPRISRLIIGGHRELQQYEMEVLEIYAAVLEHKSWFYVSSDKKQEMEMIEAYIAEHFSNQKLNVIELSQKAKMSEVHFRRLFKKIYHVSPLQFITRMRIRRAKELLLDDDSTITQIAERTGYSTVFYFSRIFKKETGMTPTEYRMKVP
jgi:AraC family transcriptional regulator, arabinose operon regulatory protein